MLFVLEGEVFDVDVLIDLHQTDPAVVAEDVGGQRRVDRGHLDRVDDGVGRDQVGQRPEFRDERVDVRGVRFEPVVRGDENTRGRLELLVVDCREVLLHEGHRFVRVGTRELKVLGELGIQTAHQCDDQGRKQ